MALPLLLTLTPMAPTSNSFPSPHLYRPPASAPTTSLPILSSSNALPFVSSGHQLHCWTNSSSSRSSRLVVRAGPPSTNSLILAFVLPLSLLVGTIITAARIADRLDEKYLEELAMNEAIMEEGDDDDEAAGGRAPAGNEGEGILVKEEEEIAAVPRVRNRPRREA